MTGSAGRPCGQLSAAWVLASSGLAGLVLPAAAKQPLHSRRHWWAVPVPESSPLALAARVGSGARDTNRETPSPAFAKSSSDSSKTSRAPPQLVPFSLSGPSLWFCEPRTIYCSSLFLKAARSSKTVAHHGDRTAGNRLVRATLSRGPRVTASPSFPQLSPALPQLPPSSQAVLSSLVLLPGTSPSL